MSIDPWCWNLTGLRVVWVCLVCHSVLAYQAVMPLPWELIVLCAGMYWTPITQGHAGPTKVCPLPCSDKEFYFCMPCWAHCANWAFGCERMQTPSVIRIHFLPSPGKPTGQPASSSWCNLTKMKYSLQLQIGQLLWVRAYEQDIPDRDLRKRIAFTIWHCFLSCDLSQILVGKVGSSQITLDKLAS